MADLAADRVFLLVEHTLLPPGGVAVVAAGYQPCLTADLAVFPVQRGALAWGDFALPHFPVDPAVLVGESRVHLGPARM